MHPPAAAGSRVHKARATREHLIATTIEVLRTRSYGSATLFEVAKAAGVTPGALQHHFGSRAMLMLEVLQSILDATLTGSQAWPAETLPLPERAQRYLQALWERVYEPPRFLAAWGVYFGSTDEAQLQPRIRAMRQQLSHSMHQRFAQVFPEARQHPALPAFVDLVLSALRGIGMSRLFGADTTAETAQRDQLARVLASWCAGAAPAPAPAPARPPPRRKETP